MDRVIKTTRRPERPKRSKRSDFAEFDFCIKQSFYNVDQASQTRGPLTSRKVDIFKEI